MFNINKKFEKIEDKKGLNGLLDNFSYFSITGLGIPLFAISFIIEIFILSFLLNTGTITEQGLNTAVSNNYVNFILIFSFIICVSILIYYYFKLRKYILENYKKVK